MLLGFGAKAGLYPLHGWLPTAHPAAPSPASAVLSGVITKAGVLGLLRVIYCFLGAQNLRGTWVQTVLMALSLLTVFIGSLLAYREHHLKKRLAWSTVSQVSYVVFGLSTLHPLGLLGAMLHVVCHSLVKDVLFMGAGAVILKTGETQVDALRGIGKRMPGHDVVLRDWKSWADWHSAVSGLFQQVGAGAGQPCHDGRGFMAELVRAVVLLLSAWRRRLT